MLRDALILGCGYTGRRVALQLLERGWRVTATTRGQRKLDDLRKHGADVLRFDVLQDAGLRMSVAGARVLFSVPTLRVGDVLQDPTLQLLGALDGTPSHITYLSTTGVYGSARVVDASTPAAPETARQRLRAEAETAVHAHGSPSLVLRPAAIYGPGRGVHAAMRAGRFQLSADGDRYVSRIHVEDLAAVVATAMERGLEGTYPVADAAPAFSREVASFCSELLGLDIPDPVPLKNLGQTRRADRRVGGAAVLRQLQLQLRYPTYREGIPASLAAESAV